MDRRDVEILSRETAYRGFYELQKLRLRHRLFDGGMSGEMERELFIRHAAVGVLPYDPLRDEIVLIEQFRVGAIDDPETPWMLELVAGLIDKDEQPREVAERETREESGLDVLELRPVTQYYSSPGGSNEYFHLYCARVDASGAGGIHGLDHEHEDIRVSVFSAGDAVALLNGGRIANAHLLVALQWFALNRVTLRESWS